MTAAWYLMIVLSWPAGVWTDGTFSRFVVEYADEASCVKHLEAMKLQSFGTDGENQWASAAWCQPYADLRRPEENLR